MDLAFDPHPDETVAEFPRADMDRLRDRTRAIIRGVVAGAIGPEHLHRITIEVEAIGPGDIRARVKGPDDLVARIEAAFEEDS